MEICIIPCHLLSAYQKSPPITIILSGSNQKPTQDANSEGDCGSSSLSAPLMSLSFPRVFLQRRQVGEGPACGVGKKETSILISCLGRILSVSLTSISGSGWIWCREDAAALIYLMFLLVLSLSLSLFFLLSTWQGHAANYRGEDTHTAYVVCEVCV